MQSNRQLIKDVMQWTYQFSRAQGVHADLSQSVGQINQPQKPLQQVNTWHDVAKKFCPQVLKLYPYQNYKKEYNEQVYLIESQLKFQDPRQPGMKWTLLKVKHEVKSFTHQWRKLKSITQQVQDDPAMIYEILENHKHIQNQKQKQVFQQFIEQIAPYNKWNVRVLGQYRVALIQQDKLDRCMDQTCFRFCQRNNHFFVTLTNENLIFSDETIANGVVEEAIPYTKSLEIIYKEDSEDKYGDDFVVKLKSGKTKIYVAFEDIFDLLKFSYTIDLIKKNTPYFNLSIRFQSFSPQRQNNWTRFYNDAQSYFSDLHDQIQLAQKKICMTGWCITPYLLLKRPENIQSGQSRLDRTLGRAAKRGVKIFILVFQEPSLFVNNDSFNVWDTFEKMDENFKVLRHPGLIVPQLWSHHEKCCIIDEKVAFMGGLDICYGRWDNHEHSVVDMNGLWSGADYCSDRLRGITEPRKFWESNLDRVNEPRMPWHDIALQFKGPAVIDIQRHFVQYWYFAIRDLSDDPRDHLRNFKTRYEQLKRQQLLKRNQTYSEEQIQKRRQNLFKKQKPDANQLALIELTYANIKKDDPNKQDYTFSERLHSARMAFKDLIQSKSNTTSKQIIVEGFAINEKPGNMNLQLCRSSCSWSTGILNVEHSIYNAYLELIQNAEEFIYIENQFFMSHENEISQKIAGRIRKAVENGKKFKVIVMMPLLPGFQGDVTSDTSAVLRVQMQIQYEAISRHQSSIYQLLSNLSININDYIGFYGLRNHGLFGPNKDIPKTEIIYVHSKLMIVDDKHMIIGSANINDRSLLGERDSELAMIINDPQGEFGKGSIFQFRCRIFKEHFGMSPSECRSLTSMVGSYWSKLNDIAKNNTLIYREVFGCYPDNTCSKYGDVAQLAKKARPELYQKKINDLYGHYVEWPLDFLKDENLNPKFGQKQFLAPKIFFT